MSASSQRSGSSHTAFGQERAQKLDLEKQPTETAADAQVPTVQYPVSDLSQGIIGWESQDDPENPQNFASSKKWSLLALISAFTLVSPLASSMFSPAVVYMGEQFGETNETILALSVSIYLIGYTVSFPVITV